MPPARIEIDQKAYFVDLEINLLHAAAVGARLLISDTDMKASRRHQELGYLVLQAAPVQPSSAPGAMGPVLDALSCGRGPLVACGTSPEDPIMAATWCGVSVPCGNGEVAYELFRQIWTHAGERRCPGAIAERLLP